MKRNFVSESLNELAKRGRKPKARLSGIDSTDSWGNDEEEYYIELEGPETVEDINIEDDKDILEFQGKLKKMLRNELASPEFNRGYATFKIRKTGEIVDAIPMAELKDSFLFKIDSKLRKIKLSDMILAESISYSSKRLHLNEGSYDDFIMNYGSEIKKALNLLRSINKKLKNNEIDEEQYNNALKKVENIYDYGVIDWIDHSIMGGYFDVSSLVNKAIENMNANGTEMQMILYAIDDIASNLNIYEYESY